MKIALACDHRGYKAKEDVKTYLRAKGEQVQDFGCDNAQSCDYPDSAFPAAESVAKRENDVAIMFCGTGIGMSIVANKVHGVRAALCHDELTAELSRLHNNTNVLCLPADLIGDALIHRVVDVWLDRSFESGRHQRRVGKIIDYENTHSPKCPEHAPGK